LTIILKPTIIEPTDEWGCFGHLARDVDVLMQECQVLYYFRYNSMIYFVLGMSSYICWNCYNVFFF